MGLEPDPTTTTTASTTTTAATTATANTTTTANITTEQKPSLSTEKSSPSLDIPSQVESQTADGKLA